MSQTIPIPRYVDAQMQIPLWEIDEVFPIVALFGMGILTDLMMDMLVLIFLLMVIYYKSFVFIIKNCSIYV